MELAFNYSFIILLFYASAFLLFIFRFTKKKEHITSVQSSMWFYKSNKIDLIVKIRKHNDLMNLLISINIIYNTIETPQPFIDNVLF